MIPIIIALAAALLWYCCCRPSRFERWRKAMTGRAPAEILHRFPTDFADCIEQTPYQKAPQGITMRPKPTYPSASEQGLKMPWVHMPSTPLPYEPQYPTIPPIESNPLIEYTAGAVASASQIDAFLILNPEINDYIKNIATLAVRDIGFGRRERWHLEGTIIEGKLQYKDPIEKTTRPIAKFPWATKWIHHALYQEIKRLNLIHRHIQKSGNVHEAVLIAHSVIRSAKRYDAERRYIAFLDITNAYGSVVHAVMRDALIHYRVQAPFIEYICWFYDNTTLVFPDNTIPSTYYFSIKWTRGIYQGDQLGNWLFTITLQYITEKITNARPWLADRMVQYVDDIMLFGEYEKPTPDLDDVQFVETTLEKYGFKTNAAKKRIILFTPTPCDAEIISGAQMHSAEPDIKYLGSYLFKNCTSIIAAEITACFEKIDKLPQQFRYAKYNVIIGAYLRWQYQVNLLTNTDRATIEDIERKYLDKWSIPPNEIGRSFAKRRRDASLRHDGTIINSRDARVAALELHLNDFMAEEYSALSAGGEKKHWKYGGDEPLV